MADTKYEFSTSRKDIYKSICRAVTDSNVTVLEDILQLPTSPRGEFEKKQVVDQAFKDLLRDFIEKNKSTEDFKNLIILAISAVKQELCSASLPFVMLSDLFDSIPLEKCDAVFCFIEQKVDEWKSWDTFYNSGKNYLLRMCNDLLRRLSKWHNTVFCGRIQLFLARLFPLTEKSGLNLMSQFNLENVTEYTTKPEDYDKARKMSMEAEKVDDMEIEEGETDEDSSIPIDYNLYRKFWHLQDYFRKPTQCYDKVAWKTFSNYAEEVLNCFDNFKLDDIKAVKKARSAFNQPHTFFAKYLTSVKLLDLQLSDCNFRRYVLIQFIILFQYLHAEVKFKNSNQVLAEEQTQWVKDYNERVYRILRETPPDGEQFAEAIEHIMNREENWNTWKNEQCRVYVKTASEEDVKSFNTKAVKKRSLGDDLKASGSKLMKMGNSELTRLWNLNQDNIGACKEEKRDYMPSLESFFGDAQEQVDPENQVDEEYWYIKNPGYSWKALRLLARRSPHFFAQQTGQNTNQNRTVPKYLENTLVKMNKEKNQASSNDSEAKADAADSQPGAGSEEAEDSTLDKDQEDSPKDTGAAGLVSEDQLQDVAERLKADWNKLATELNFPDDDITFIANENESVVAQGHKLLTLWKENEADRASEQALRAALREIGQAAVAEAVFGPEES